MPIDPEDVRQHYASLSDDALLLVEREDLTPAAQKIFDSEVRRRSLETEAIEIKEDDKEEFVESNRFDGHGADEEEEPEWLENAFAVSVFSNTPSGIGDAEDSRKALVAAGIPCEVTEHEIDPADESVGMPYREFRVMVPNAYSLRATSILDAAIFNARMEADWKTQLESLTTEELQALNVDELCAGLLDRAERLRKAYKTELARRKASPSGESR